MSHRLTRQTSRLREGDSRRDLIITRQRRRSRFKIDNNLSLFKRGVRNKKIKNKKSRPVLLLKSCTRAPPGSHPARSNADFVFFLLFFSRIYFIVRIRTTILLGPPPPPLVITATNWAPERRRQILCTVAYRRWRTLTGMARK